MSVAVIQRGYEAVCNASPADSFRAYADYYHELEGLDIVVCPTELQRLEHHDTDNLDQTAWHAIWRTRFSERTEQPGQLYFRGSGIITVGVSDGRLLSVQYEHKGERDPVDERYPGYQCISVRKAALAVAVGRLLSDDIPVGRQYTAIEEQLHKVGIDSGGFGHHLGYAVLQSTHTELLVSGASGMLPSKETDDFMRLTNGDKLAQDSEHGLLDGWDGNAFAGYHDAIAAETTLHNMTRGLKLKQGALVLGRTIEDYPGANLH